MKSFVYTALVVFLGTVAVQGYGPKIHRKKHEGPQKSSHNRPSHGSHHGPPHRPHHPGPHQRPHRRPHYFGPPNQHGNWDNSPKWDYRSDSRVSSGDRGSYGSYGPDDSYGLDDSYGPFDYSRERDSSDYFRSSYEDYYDSYDRHHPKHPSKPPHNKKPPNTTPRPIPTRPKPIPTTPKPIPTTNRIPRIPTLPPHPAQTRFTPRPIGTTAAWRLNSTTPQIIPRPTGTADSIPRPPIPTTTASRPTWHPTPPTVDTTHWEPTTISVPETTSFIPLPTTNPNPGVETTTAEEGFPTISPEIVACIDLCPSTPEYNPVCGSDGVTYNNEGKLFCAGSCGVNVTLVRRSACPPPSWDYEYDDGTETLPPRTTTIIPFQGRTTSLSNFQRCMRLCHITASFTPVCGTDLVTYMNMDRLKCAQSCGEVVEVLCEKPCAACGFNPVTPETTQRPSTTPQIDRSTQEPDIQDCINGCPVTTEYNPVCGSNHVTYRNPNHLICAQLCGVGVAVSRLGPCGSSTTSSTTTTVAPTPTLSPDVLSCIRRCPVTTEYDPVCGSDDLTYNNLGNLDCSKFCGVEVDLKHKSRCVDEFDLGPDGTDSTPNHTKPSQSTATTTPLFTSSTTTATTRTTTTAIPPTTSTTSLKSTSTTSAGAIPNDVLIDIFGPNTTQVPSTKDINENKEHVTRPSQSTATTTPLFTSPITTTTATNTTTAIPPTTSTTSLKSTSTTSAGPNSSTTLGFTIPNDVLIDIFGPTTTQVPSTKPKNPDEDEDIDLDARFNTETNTDKDIGRGHYSKIVYPD